MKQRSGFSVMARLVGLVRPLVGYMLLAIAMGLLGHACAALITVFGGYALLELLHFPMPLGLGALFACMLVFAVLRGAFRYAEQTCQPFHRLQAPRAHPRSGVPRAAPALSGQA